MIHSNFYRSNSPHQNPSHPKTLAQNFRQPVLFDAMDNLVPFPCDPSGAPPGSANGSPLRTSSRGSKGLAPPMGKGSLSPMNTPNFASGSPAGGFSMPNGMNMPTALDRTSSHGSGVIYVGNRFWDFLGGPNCKGRRVRVVMDF